MVASLFGYLDTARTLLEYGANVGAKNNVRNYMMTMIMMMMMMMMMMMIVMIVD
jgi:ABC-type Na+ efflux pump permease subunit